MALGLPLDRIDFVRPEPRDGYLRCAAEVDVMLDAFPFSGQTTTSEYLWMGVPPITLCGDRPAGRVSASILTHLGLPELIAATPGEYVAIASRLAGNIPGLAELRGRTPRPLQQDAGKPGRAHSAGGSGLS